MNNENLIKMILIYTSTHESVRIGISFDFNDSRKSERFIMRNTKLGKNFVALFEELGAIFKTIQTGEKVEISFLS